MGKYVSRISWGSTFLYIYTPTIVMTSAIHSRLKILECTFTAKQFYNYIYINGYKSTVNIVMNERLEKLAHTNFR